MELRPIKRTSGLYRFLSYVFDAYAFYHRRTESTSWYSQKGLEASDFCRIVRVVCLYVPLIMLFQFTILASIIYLGLIFPFLISFDPISILMPMGSIALVIGVSCGVIIGLILLGTAIGKGVERARERSPKNTYYSSASFKEKPAATAWNFITNAAKTLKGSTCFLVTFEGPPPS